MICPKCNNDNVQVVAMQKPRSVLTIIMHIALSIITGGIWLIVVLFLLVKGKKSNTNYVCMTCGKQWK